MCAQFMIRASAKKTAARYGVSLEGTQADQTWPERILPYSKCPVVIRSKEVKKLAWMQFSLLPHWSKAKRVKFATHNARLDGIDEKTHKKVMIYEKPTWREAFTRRHCLIPITDFFEPIYVGEHAGHMVRFFPQTDEMITAAGIWEEWIGKTGEVIESFTMLTDEPIPFIKGIGHDRSPVFLRDSAFDLWLADANIKPEKWIEFLRNNKLTPKLGIERDRALKPGWEKKLTA